MNEIDFDCPHCGQNLSGPEDLAGQTIDCPVCNKSFVIPGGLTEIPPPPAPEEPAAPAPDPALFAQQSQQPASDADKGKTVRIELPPEFLAEPEKHVFNIKRIHR
jgi:hypothetical protein